MFQYTLIFIFHKDEVLLINRHKNPWKGCWNGVGGKINPEEKVKTSARRELHEETGLMVNENDLVFHGVVTWNVFHAEGQGLYLFSVHIEDKKNLKTLVETEEGIIVFKPIEWAAAKDNLGMASNIPFFLMDLVEGKINTEYRCFFKGNRLEKVEKVSLSTDYSKDVEVL